jgi:hypothetical protein
MKAMQAILRQSDDAAEEVAGSTLKAAERAATQLWS